MICHKRNAVRK